MDLADGSPGDSRGRRAIRKWLAGVFGGIRLIAVPENWAFFSESWD